MNGIKLCTINSLRKTLTFNTSTSVIRLPNTTSSPPPAPTSEPSAFGGGLEDMVEVSFRVWASGGRGVLIWDCEER
jgi:hypothetical protein